MVQDKGSQATEVKVGDIVKGTVEQILPYGAFVRLPTGQKAMIHISELAYEYVKKVEDILQLQQEVEAKVIKIDERSRIDLSVKQLQARAERPRQQRGPVSAADDFEKKLASFMKASDQKLTDLSRKKENTGGKPRGKK
ncbi:MAG TPA: S1 RNA-binding domain-containing protein [Synergistales bacterium]|jgi:S1 RNA binding domain protein|nr:S1 RNA-binding domain-containing protein [Synergistales bacterium]